MFLKCPYGIHHICLVFMKDSEESGYCCCWLATPEARLATFTVRCYVVHNSSISCCILSCASLEVQPGVSEELWVISYFSSFPAESYLTNKPGFSFALSIHRSTAYFWHNYFLFRFWPLLCDNNSNQVKGAGSCILVVWAPEPFLELLLQPKALFQAY